MNNEKLMKECFKKAGRIVIEYFLKANQGRSNSLASIGLDKGIIDVAIALFNAEIKLNKIENYCCPTCSSELIKEEEFEIPTRTIFEEDFVPKTEKRFIGS